MRVVLDTNVIISALNFTGNERLVLELALRGRFELFLSPLIMDEVAGVLTRKFGWEEERSSQAIRILRDTATIVDPPQIAEAIKGSHPDNQVLDCAVFTSADYLITGDRRHLLPIGEYQGSRIVNASRFLSELGA